MKALAATIRGALGIDLSILYTILARGLQAGGGLITIGLISLFLTKEEQGYYYTFGSLLAVQVFFELGLTSIITQYVAHEAINVRWLSASELSGPPENLSRLASLLALCFNVFGILSALLFVVLVAGGFTFFSTYKVNSSTVHWQWPWVIVSLSTALLLIVNPILAFLEGLGQVKEVAQFRMKQQIISIITVLIILGTKGGLYAQGIASLVSFLFLSSSIVFSYRKQLLLTIYRHASLWKVSYRKEIFPYQYKIALSWISGYLLVQLFNPILFATQGAVVAGQMGMTLAALNGVSTISMSWVSTKITLFSSLIARKNYKELDSVFETTLRQLMIVSVVLLTLFIVMIESINVFNTSLRDRFLPLTQILFLCLATFINQIIFSWATYLRCHKQEPFLLISVLNGILCAFSSIIMGHYFGITGMVLGYTVLTALIGGLGGYYIFVTKKNEWHGV
ncbi:hypothetical protein EXU85_32605 [Spirosoma sp. KCTC 42546]|uniref:hypothetical protein n=1 Tax=Spirosoma sp. KCTC 42546 TaxID=2520506 RepID=UPI00115B78B7|nr:hypothetical protein [Spirosoma sp. KCTC 42546]QDK83089.1 hypothetical protein EXU85_32605 [Spirosoma sp. KCTC 42546]